MEKLLTELKFKKIYSDALVKDFFFWRKNIKHSFLKGLHICVDENTISVYCKEVNIAVGKLRSGNGNEFTIIFMHRTKNNLLKIIKLLTK